LGIHSLGRRAWGLELVLAVAVLVGVDRHAGWNELVDAVEDVRAERAFGGGQVALELVHGAGSDDGRGDAGVVDHEGDGQLDQGHTGLLGHHGRASLRSPQLSS
jgi:hypothetical protein